MFILWVAYFPMKPDPNSELRRDFSAFLLHRVQCCQRIVRPWQVYDDTERPRSFKLEFHGTDTDTDIDNDIRNAPIV